MKKILLIVLMGSSLTGCITTSRNNEHIGNIVKIKQSGAFCPTWEVELIRTRVFTNSNNNSNMNVSVGKEEYFTVSNTGDLIALKYSLEHQKEVKIMSHEEFATICRSDSGNEFIDKVEVEGKI